MAETHPAIAEVPELHAVVVAYERKRQIEKLDVEAGKTLAVAVFEAAKIATPALIASAIGVTRQRVSQLQHKGREAQGVPKARRKPKKKPTWKTPQPVATDERRKA